MKQLLAGLVLLALSHQATACSPAIAFERKNIIKQYVQDLQNADYKDITLLFEKNGYVISTSRGKMGAKEFFYSFLPEITSAKTELKQIYFSHIDHDRIAARFHFSYQLKSGEAGEGEYIDEFAFATDSEKLASVYMFENLKA